MPNVFEPDWDEPRDHPGFAAKRARVGRQAGSERTGLSVWELPAGQAAYPYHLHFAEEEILVVLEGRPSLRTPDGWRRLECGEVVAFPVGEQGAHQLLNETDEVARFLAFSNQAPDVCVYPDSGKVMAAERRPDGGGLKLMFRQSDAVDYHDGEEPPATRP